MARARRPALGFAEADILRAEVVMLTVRRVILSISYSVSGLESMSWWFAEEMNRHWQSPTFMQWWCTMTECQRALAFVFCATVSLRPVYNVRVQLLR